MPAFNKVAAGSSATTGTTSDPKTREFIGNETIKTSTLLQDDVKLSAIRHEIGGMKWSVDYYLQVRAVNDAVSAPDINISATTQKYHKIKNVILTLTSPIVQGKIEEIQGECIINCGFTPNKCDVFIATMANGRDAIFILEDYDVNHFNLHKVYKATFKLFWLIDSDNKVYNDIINKVIEEYTYDKDHLADYSAPVILSSDYNKKLDLKYKIPELTEYYFKHFINRDRHILSIPSPTTLVTDTLLTSFLLNIINVTDSLDSLKLATVDIDLSETIKYTVWDAIINRDRNILNMADTDVGFRYLTPTASGPMTRAAIYLRINYIVDKLNGLDPAKFSITDISKNKPNDYEDPIYAKEANDGSYIFSKYFYNNDTTKLGPLEKLLNDYFNDKVLDTDILNKLLNQFYCWSTVEQYYLIPILIVLIRDAVSKTFRSL